MQNFLKIIVLLQCIFCTLSITKAQNLSFTGTWTSTHGNLMLVQQGNKVIGDYGNKGTIEGIYNPTTRQLTGTFDNRNINRKGNFVFTLSPDGKSFKGAWGFDNSPPKQKWDGSIENTNTPTLQIAKLPDATQTNSSSFTGTWSSTHGNLMLIQHNNIVAGDYSNKGGIQGTYNPTTRQLTGTFDNRNIKRNGNFVFTLSPDGKSFKGSWGFDNSPPKQKWDGNINNSTKPILKIAQSPEPIQSNINYNTNGQIHSGVQMTVKKKTYNLPVYGTKDLPNNGNNGQTNSSNSNVQCQNYAPNSNAPMEIKKGTGQNIERGGKVLKTEDAKDGYVCTTQEYNVTAAFNENYLLSASNPQVFPGNIISASSLAIGSLTPVGGQRKPYKISSSAYGYATAQEASISEARKAVKQILPHSTKTAANAIYESQTINSKADLKLFLGVGYEDGINKIKASAGYKSTTKKNVVLVKFIQVYYTVDMDRPTYINPNSLYTDGTPVCSDHLVISSVGMGRALYFLAETDYEAQHIEGMINYVYESGPQKVGVKATADYQKIFNESKVSVVAIGGSASDALKVISSMSQLKNYIQNGANFSKNSLGVPIFFRLRFLETWEESNIKFFSTVQRRNCAKTKGKFRLTLDRMICFSEDDLGSGEELYGIGYCRGFGPDGKLIKAEGNPYVNGGKYGRFWEVLPQNAREIDPGDAAPIGKSITFEFIKPANMSFERMLEKAYIELTLEMKEEDVGDDEIYGKERVIIPLNKANIEKLKGPVSQLRNAADPLKGIVQFMSGGSRAAITFMIEPLME